VRKPCKGQKWGCLCHPGGQVSEFPFEDSEHGCGAVAAELPPAQHTFFAASVAAVFTPSTTVLTTLTVTWPLCGGIFASDFSIVLNGIRGHRSSTNSAVKQSKKQRKYADCPSGRMAERKESFQGHPEKFLVGERIWWAISYIYN
jgi:hypothetical protein